MRILLAEDQKDLNEIIARKLQREGYAVDACFDGNDAVSYLACAEYDAVILDIMLPGLTGIGVLRDMRGRGDDTPVLLLTALGDVDDRVAGLDAGADDYMVKPFDFSELMARIRSLTRRRSRQTSSVITCRDLEVDTAARTVKRGGREIELTAREFNILEYMLHNIGRAVTRDNLSTHIWNYDYDGGSNVIDVYMHHLRKKLEDGASEEDGRIIETVKGVGYIIR